MAVTDEINALKSALAALEAKHAANPEPPPPPPKFALPNRGTLSGTERGELETVIRDLIDRVESLETLHPATPTETTTAATETTAPAG